MNNKYVVRVVLVVAVVVVIAMAVYASPANSAKAPARINPATIPIESSIDSRIIPANDITINGDINSRIINERTINAEIGSRIIPANDLAINGDINSRIINERIWNGINEIGSRIEIPAINSEIPGC